MDNGYANKQRQYLSKYDNEEESMSDNEKMFLYARSVHSNHSIQYHIHQIMERQRVVNEYRNMMMEGIDLILLESNLHKFHPVIISQIVNMIESGSLALQDIRISHERPPEHEDRRNSRIGKFTHVLYKQ